MITSIWKKRAEGPGSWQWEPVTRGSKIQRNYFLSLIFTSLSYWRVAVSAGKLFSLPCQGSYQFAAMNCFITIDTAWEMSVLKFPSIFFRRVGNRNSTQWAISKHSGFSEKALGEASDHLSEHIIWGSPETAKQSLSHIELCCNEQLTRNKSQNLLRVNLFHLPL